VERERATGRAVFGQAWSAWLAQLRQVKDLKLVVIDTLNTTLHGEENNATVINEYVQAAAAVICGELGAALIVTHHVRKPGPTQNLHPRRHEELGPRIHGADRRLPGGAGDLACARLSGTADRIGKEGRVGCSTISPW
jgi:hypothetical protein